MQMSPADQSDMIMTQAADMGYSGPFTISPAHEQTGEEGGSAPAILGRLRLSLGSDEQASAASGSQSPLLQSPPAGVRQHTEHATVSHHLQHVVHSRLSFSESACRCRRAL